MNDILALIRPDLKGFGGYSSAASEASGPPPAIKLDANESPWPPFGAVANFCNAHRYAEPQPLALRGRMAALWGVEAEQILLTCGSDQGIDVLLRLFCRAGEDEILVCPPTFAMYQVYAQIQGASVITVPLLENGQLDVPAILAAATDQTKLIFLPTPHAPTGHAMNKADILALCEGRAGKSLIVADEAYVEFSSTPAGLAPYINKTPNLALLRTLSKAHALAGDRVGCVIAGRELVQALRTVLPPYPLAQSAVRAALDALSPAGLA
ncbi:MAG: aminotransferase class I/II-fold pyridoxal phosphate-dependent enzyme, partial [Alphaproteobacteria bacterium]|nr:aminotransferase class I/II-fold pyridoxal phosphate-dependent enzyme [Alphaproteobacteria bacterium]